jgi:hypothetical protein
VPSHDAPRIGGGYEAHLWICNSGAQQTRNSNIRSSTHGIFEPRELGAHWSLVIAKEPSSRRVGRRYAGVARFTAFAGCPMQLRSALSSDLGDLRSACPTFDLAYPTAPGEAGSALTRPISSACLRSALDGSSWSVTLPNVGYVAGPKIVCVLL